MVETNVVIIGGGVAGLWLLNRVRQLNYSAILLESNTLGGGQTHMSQGIIHGGMKYALQGKVTSATEAISDMPAIWGQCLRGQGILDLSRVKVLSQNQYLWSSGSLKSKLAGLFSNLILNGNVDRVSKEKYPDVFQHPLFNGQVYSLNEIVLDANSLVEELAEPNKDVIFKIDPLTEKAFHLDANGNLASIEIQATPLKSIHLKADIFIFTAGKGNEILANIASISHIKTQRRPLHMVLVKTDLPYKFYAHCLGLGATPRITVTTHQAKDGKIIWYLGGQLAEEGVTRNSDEQIAIARKELKDLFPWLDFSNADFATVRVDRAEALQSDGKRPDTCTLKEVGNMLVAWPTKLAFAPQLAEEIVMFLQKKQLQPIQADMDCLRTWPTPGFSKPVWDQLL